MNVFNYIPRFIIKKSFKVSVWLIERSSNMERLDDKVNDLRLLPHGSVGNAIAKCLDDNELRLVAGYESHDLKHVLLDYKMTPVDEIRMQAFMLGNGNYTLPCFAILIFGIILLPGQWLQFFKDYIKGRQSQPISLFTIEDYKDVQLHELRRQVFNKRLITPIIDMNTVVRFGAFSAIIMGILGMVFCLPFLFSSSLEDLVGAGFPFVGGSILAVGGLLSLSNMAGKQNKLQHQI